MKRAKRILLVGGIGTGKTTLLGTIPGKTFIYAFDPAFEDAIEDRFPNVSYELFLPGVLDLGVKPLASKTKKDQASPQTPTVYPRWVKHFEEASRSGFFDQFDTIGIDSCTTFLSAIMDRVQFLNGRLGKHPEQADYSVQMHTFLSAWRTLTGIEGKNIVGTAHEYKSVDLITKESSFDLLLTGRLRITLPILFSDVLLCKSQQAGSKRSFKLRTTGALGRTYLRCSVWDAPIELDVTLTGDTPSKGLPALFPSLEKEKE